MRPDLAACYGEERLPRYTSYPTAPHFSPAIGRRQLRRLAEGDPARRPRLALSACAVLPGDVLVLRLQHLGRPRVTSAIAVYAAALRCEIDMVARAIDRRLQVDHIHFGGGTPTIMAPEYPHRPDRRAPACLLCAAHRRDRGRDRPAHADGRDDRRARLWRRQPGEPRGAELRSARCSAPSTACRALRRPPPRPRACGGPVSAASTST